MSKIITASSTGLVFLSAIIAGATYAGNELETLNSEVEIKAQQLSIDNGVGLTHEQKNDLKIAMIAAKVAEEKNIAYQEKAAMVIATYQLVDPRDQHKLLVAMAGDDES